MKNQSLRHKVAQLVLGGCNLADLYHVALSSGLAREAARAFCARMAMRYPLTAAYSIPSTAQNGVRGRLGPGPRTSRRQRRASHDHVRNHPCRQGRVENPDI